MSEEIKTGLLGVLDNMDAIDDSMPLLPARQYLFKVDKIELITSKLKEGELEAPGVIKIVEDNQIMTGNMLKIRLTLVEPATDVLHKPIHAGFPIITRISLVEKETYDPAKQCKRFRRAVTGEKGGKFFPLNQYVGKNVTVAIKIQDAKGDFPMSNAVKDWVIPAE